MTRLRSSDPTDGSSPSTLPMPAANLSDEDPASISPEEQARRRAVVADQRALLVRYGLSIVYAPPDLRARHKCRLVRIGISPAGRTECGVSTQPRQ